MTPVAGELAPVLPPDVLARYERWLALEPPADSYLFSDVRVRLEPRPDDVLIALPELSTREHAEGSLLHAPARQLIVPRVTHHKLRAFLGQLDGVRSLRDASRTAELDASELRSLLDVAFGIVLFAPLALAELERAASACEIVRFPGSPYEIVRNYWQNAGAVRRRLPALEGARGDTLAALAELRALHATLLVGDDRATFYRPASPISNKGVHPGTLYDVASQIEPAPEGPRFVAGPRVNATLLGGAAYGALLAELAGDRDGVRDREHRDSAGLDWGRVVTARAVSDPEFVPWFCPPRPLSLEHFASLFASLERARRAKDEGNAGAAVLELSCVHQKFVRLHPFRAANQSLAMMLVNETLRALFGVGIPHLVLDHLALRLKPEAYQRVFALAVDGYTVQGSPAERLRALGAQKQRSYALIGALAATPSIEDAMALCREQPEAARLSLLAV